MTLQNLEQAIQQCDIERVKNILAHEPSLINQADDKGVPMSHAAARQGNPALTRYIVEYSMASMNTRDAQYRSILHHAVLSGKVESIPYLVERVGLSALDGDRNLVTPWDIAHERHYDEIDDYFAAHYGMRYQDTYHNPIRTGMYPDPSIVRVGDDYYMVNSTFIYFPCIPVSHSRDLLHWDIIGHAITNPVWAHLDDLEGGRGYWAPDISYHNGRFYVTATYRLNDTGTVRRRQIILSSERPEGPYSEPFYIEEDGIDPSLFHDDDGRSYMLLNRGARILELDLEKGKQISPATLLFYGDQKRAPEGPHLLKKDGWYYLFEAEGGTGEGHRITVSRSRSLMGTYEPCPYNPIMRQWLPDAPIQRCGHGKPVQTQRGDWYMVYLCGRQIDGQYSMLGRETALDPITWTPDGWPIVNHLRGPGCQQKKPFPEMADETTPSEAGFAGKEFMTPRTPTASGIVIEGNRLTLEGSREDLHSMHAKNIYVRRQSDFVFTAGVTLDCSALTDGQDAGMTCYYDENTYLKYGVFVYGSRYFLEVTEQVDEECRVAFSMDVSALLNTAKRIRLRIDTDHLTRRFYYAATVLTQESLLGTLDNVYYLCDEGIRRGKRFTGAMIGVYAYTGDTLTRVCFEDFTYQLP